MMPTCADVSFQPPCGAAQEAANYHESERMPDRCEIWQCEGSRRYPHPMTLNKTRRSRCRVCGFDRRHRFADEERVVMA